LRSEELRCQHKPKGVIFINVSYCRVSTREQRLDRQLEGLKPYNIEKEFTEKISGKNMERPELKKCLEFCREGDNLYVLEFSRLARSTKDLLEIVELLKEKKVNLISVKENFDMSTPQGMLMATMLFAISSFERQVILQRTLEGVALAKAAGKYKGRKPIEVEDFKPYYDAYMQREISKSQLAKKLKISRPTLNRLFDDYTRTQNP